MAIEGLIDNDGDGVPETLFELHNVGDELYKTVTLTGSEVAANGVLHLHFKLDYVKADGDLSTYTPDFIVRTSDGTVFIVETKGRKELDLPQKMKRLAHYCADANAVEEDGTNYDLVFVDQEGFQRNTPKTFAALNTSFREYR